MAEGKGMDAKSRRKVLNAYHAAARQMELAEVCIGVLESMRGMTALRCIKSLKTEKQRVLKQMDEAAEKLGAPYGA